MSNNLWVQPLKPKPFKGTWKMSTYSPTLINQNKFQTISQKDSQPVVPAVKKPENGSMKSLITQAGYSGKVVAYHIPERENKDGPLLPPQRE